MDPHSLDELQSLGRSVVVTSEPWYHTSKGNTRRVPTDFFKTRLSSLGPTPKSWAALWWEPQGGRWEKELGVRFCWPFAGVGVRSQVAAVVRPDAIFVANAGDSRAALCLRKLRPRTFASSPLFWKIAKVLCRRGKAIDMSQTRCIRFGNHRSQLQTMTPLHAAPAWHLQH